MIKRHAHSFFLFSFFFLLFAAMGCPRASDQKLPVTVAPGVLFVEDEAYGVQLLSINQAEADVVPIVVAQGVQKRGGNYVGDVKSVREWAEQHQAIAGINANFFGERYDNGAKRQIIQMAMVNGKVVAPASITITDTSQEYRRCAVGFDKKGTPSLAWASGENPVLSWERPVDATESVPWRVQNAASCGPRLIQGGRRMITAKAERLVSQGRLQRAFVAFDNKKHLVLGRADAMQYEDIVAYLRQYFKATYQTEPQEAMCLDGGPSAQIVYHDAAGSYVDAYVTGVTVPTAILLVPRNAVK
jgi:exopolysaccharide biosynthesis protein